MKCSICLEERKIYNKSSVICKRCYNKLHPPRKRKCYECGLIKETHSRKDGRILCQNCYNKKYDFKRDVCSNCNNLRPIVSRIDKPICNTCRIKIKYPIESTLRKRLCNAFKRYSKNGKIKSSREYGIDYKKIFDHIGPCPGRREEYHIDHIFPLSAFNFDDPNNVKIAFSPENHRWMKSGENLKKGKKYDKEKLKEFMFILEGK
jgi:ribosomal protein L37E